MKLLREGDKNVSRLLGKQALSRTGTILRPSRYVLSYTAPDGSCCLWNELMRSLLLLESPEELAFFNFFPKLEDRWTEEPKLQPIPLSLADTAAGGFLLEHYFLLPTEKEEWKLYQESTATLRLSSKKSAGIHSFTILTTTCCNARCAYCYEAGMPQVTMTPETARATADFIFQKRDPGRETKLTWLGGEPLMEQGVIDIITRRLREAGVDFYSSIVTNGYLFDEETARKAAEDWQTRYVQVTLDGTEERYNRIKAYVDPEGSPFRRVLDHVHLLVRKGLPVVIRINAAAGYMADSEQLACQLREEFEPEELRLVYAFNLFMTGNTQIPFGEAPDSVKTYMDKVDALQIKLQEMGLQRVSWQEKMISKPLERLPLSSCKAGSMEASVIIHPSGKLTNCQNCLPDDFYGDVWQGVSEQDVWNRLKNPALAENCRVCPFLPTCTERNALCPDRIKWCGWSKKRDLKKALDQWWEKQA